jgi:DUF1680 family protein
MKIRSAIIFLAALLFTIPSILTAQHGYPYQPVSFSEVKITDGFWADRLKAHLAGTIPVAIEQIRDSTSRIDNFRIAAGLMKGKYKGLVWDDSDVYKVMEGIAYVLQQKRDSSLEKLMDEWIAMFAKAQLPDGYLNTYFILSQEDDGLGRNLGRWSDMGRHEMYCAGHMIEAAVAYQKATGKTNFLEVAKKFADNMLNTFGPYKRRWVPLHQEPELALVKLYKATNEKKYLHFAHWLLEERGRGREAGPMWDNGPARKYIDCHTDIPVKDIKEAWGHAVRAMYMYSGMMDVALSLNDSTYLPAVNRAWNDAIPAKMYVTGGVGSRREGEAFGEKYELPNKEAYCETCSSVGMVLWNSRMNALYGDAKYANVVERTLYNALLAGVSLDGRKVFYTNPLESDGRTHRGEKYGIACCPSNIARFMPSVGNYVYMTRGNELFVNLFMTSESNVTMNNVPVKLIQQTGYPFDGNVSVSVGPETPVDGKIKILIPDWCKSYTVTINNRKVGVKQMEAGYLTLIRKWKKGDVIQLNLDMPVEMVTSDPRVTNNSGRRAVKRGPLVYCVEQADNPGIDLNNLTLSGKNTFRIVDGDGVLKGTKKLETMVGKDKVTFVPYYAWENRQPGKMLVWTRYSD